MKLLLNEAIKAHYQQIATTSLVELFKEQPQRAADLTLDVAGLYCDFSKNKLTNHTLELLIDFAHKQGLEAQIKAMFSGEKINTTEDRAVLHSALRSDSKHHLVAGQDVMVDINQVKQQMEHFCGKIHSGEHKGYSGKAITTLVNIGIGGSDLGPALLCQALKPYRHANMQIHFISSVDGYMVNDVLADIDPETSLFIVVSKTFTTQETMTNAHTVRTWLLNKAGGNPAAIAQHFVAVSTNATAVHEFGIKQSFAFWDFVGGRYSCWSAVGLSAALYLGYANFSRFLAGARAMDQHFSSTSDLRANLPVILALISIWYVNFFDYRSVLISPYNTRLTRLPAYIQQLAMESNGKSVSKAGVRLNYATCPIVWGDSGINGQHAYYQLLHQGTQVIPLDIIVTAAHQFSNQQHNDILWANALAQAEALMVGKTHATALAELLAQGVKPEQAEQLAEHKVFSGNRPSTMLVLPELNPYYLGMLLALYEHKVFVEGVIWEINSFDQMGVELGKQLANNILTDITTRQAGSHDASTTALIKHYLAASSAISR